MIYIDHQMGAAGTIAGARQQAGERERPEGDHLGIESRAGQQVEMVLEILFARKRRDHERFPILATDAGKGHGGIVNGEGQMLFEGEGDDLGEPPAIVEGEGEQPLSDELTGERRNDDIGSAGRIEDAGDSGREVEFVGAALLLLFNTASIIAMLKHYGQDKAHIYAIDIRHLDAGH